MDSEMATAVVKQETDSSLEPAPECSTAWSPIDDDDGQQHTGLQNMKFEKQNTVFEDSLEFRVKNGATCSDTAVHQIKIERQEDGFGENGLPMKNVQHVESTLQSGSTINQMATVVVKQETDSSLEPAPECSTTWSPIDDDDDGQQHTGLGFCQIFIKEEVHVDEQDDEAGEGCSEEEVDCITVNRSGPEMWPSICSTSGHLNASQVGRLDSHNAHSVSPEEKCTESSVTGVKLYSCAHCSYKTPKFDHLKSHIRKHTGEKPFGCEFCDFECSQSSSLKRHLRTHTGDKPFSCEYCDYECSHLGNLKVHLRTHTGEKHFSCEFCDYKCCNSSHLKRHLKTHTGDKPFSCEYCDYKCCESSTLKVHLRTHTGEKHFSCELCNFKCARSYHLKSHVIRRHSSKTPSSC